MDSKNIINLNKLAKEVSEIEGGAVNLSIAQIKEVIKVYNDILEEQYDPSDILKMLGYWN